MGFSPIRRCWCVVLMVLFTSPLLGGCYVTFDRSSGRTGESHPAHPLVRDNKAVLDFTRRPTREAFGYAPERQFTGADAMGPPIEVTLKLPTGTVELRAIGISTAVDTGGGGDDHVFTHVPKHFVVNVIYPNADAAFEALEEQTSVLKLDPYTMALFRPDIGTGAVVPQARVINGLVQGWLDVHVEVRDEEYGEVQVIYEIGVDFFHNEAVDKVVHEGRYRLDLTSTPSREALAFLPTYRRADINAELRDTIDCTVVTARGTLRMMADAVSSLSGDPDDGDADPGGVEPPSDTMISVSGSNEVVRAELAGNAKVLSIDPKTLEKLFDRTSPFQRDVRVATMDTDVFHLEVLVTTQPDDPSESAAAISYRFTFS